MPYWALYISANTSTRNDPRNEVTKPDMMDGIAAGRITFVSFFGPVKHSVAALSR